MNGFASRRAVRVQSALLAREYTADVTGATLVGVFTEVTPLGDLRGGRHSETKCYAYVQLIGVECGDVVNLHLIDSEGQTLQKYSCRLDSGFRNTPSLLPYTLVAPLTIPHFLYGLHQLTIEHDGVEIGDIPFDVKSMPNPFGSA